jgi:hypothetical protein
LILKYMVQNGIDMLGLDFGNSVSPQIIQRNNSTRHKAPVRMNLQPQFFSQHPTLL